MPVGLGEYLRWDALDLECPRLAQPLNCPFGLFLDLNVPPLIDA